MQFQFKETNAAMNMFAAVGIYLIDNSGTLKSTLLSLTVDGTEASDSAYTNRTVLASASLSSQSCANGDRILVEIGYYANNTKTTSYTGGLTYGADSSLSDLAVNDTTTGNYLGWIEFSQDHVVYNAPPVVTLNTADESELSSTPTLEFTGVDAEAETMTYRIQIASTSLKQSIFVSSQYTGILHINDGDSGFTTYYSNSSGGIRGIAIDPSDGDIYLNIESSDIYKQTGGEGSFNALSQGALAWYGIAVAPDGDVYASVWNVGIYKQTGGAGNFSIIHSQATGWRGMCCAPNGDVYASGAGGLYKQTGGSGSFTITAFTSACFAVAVSPEGDVYVAAYSELYKQIGGSGSFSLFYTATSTIVALAISEMGDLYFGVSGQTFKVIRQCQGDPIAIDPSTSYNFADIAFEELGILIDKTSDVDTGFINTVDSGDTDPFTNNQKISYTVQEADALGEGTYYWRVAAEDIGGSGSFGDWTAERTFTVVTPSDVLVNVPLATMTLVAEELTWSATGQFNVGIPKATMTLTAEVPSWTDWTIRAYPPTASMELQALVPYIDIGKTRIRQEINILCHVLSAASGSDATSDEIVYLDDDFYPGGTFYFEIVGYTSSSLAVDIKLRRKGTSTDDATCSIPAGTTAPARIRSTSFTPPTTATEYVVYIPNTAGATKNVVSARIIIIQEACPIEKTETQYEIGNYETGKSDVYPLVPLSYPKYFKFEEDKYDAIMAAYVEVVCKVSESGEGLLAVQVVKDDGAFGSWSYGANPTNACAAITPTRFRSDVFNLKNGRHYRLTANLNQSGKTYDIYSAKIIVHQAIGLYWNEARPSGDVERSWYSAAMSGDGQKVFAANQQEGTYRSFNYGETWGLCTSHYGILAVSDDGDYLLIAGGNRLYLSSDSGDSWEEIQPDGDRDLYWNRAGAAISGDGQYMIVAARKNDRASGKVWVSDDWGESWTQTRPDGNWTNVNVNDTGQYMYCWEQISTFDYRFYVSDDYGASWTERNVDGRGDDLYSSRMLTCMSESGQYGLKSSQANMWKTTDYGVTWSRLWPIQQSFYHAFGDGLAMSASGQYAIAGYTYEHDAFVSSDYGATWTRIWPGREITNYNYYAMAIDDTGENMLAGGWYPNPYMGRLYVKRTTDKITKHRPEALVLNTLSDSTGLKEPTTLFDPDEWKGIAVDLHHVIDTSTDTGDSAKLQDVSGTPQDITDSTATGANRAVSSLLSVPEATEIGSYVLNAPVYASKIVIDAAQRLAETIEAPVANMTLTPLEPTIYPLKLPVPSVSMQLIAKTPGYYIPPQIKNYPPAASMQLKTRTVSISWEIAEDAVTANFVYLLTLTGAGDGLEDIELPASYIKACLTDVFDSYVVAVIPADIGYEDEILLRTNGEMVVSAGYELANGTVLSEEIFRVPYKDMSISTGGRRKSVTITGYGEVAVGIPKERTARNVSAYRKYSTGKRAVTSDMDLFLRCRDSFIYGTGGNDWLIVGSIEYEIGVNPLICSMTVKEE
jgi:photosystem II stability/assembly factor-like uncharacterized protein